MGEKNVTTVVESTVEAKRLFTAYFKESKELLPKVLPDVFTSVTYEGDGGVGSLRHIVLGPASTAPFPFVKERLDEVDEANLRLKYSVVEGGLLGDRASAARVEVQFSAKADGTGSIITHNAYVTPLPGTAPLDPEKIKDFQSSIAQVAQALDAYLLANP